MDLKINTLISYYSVWVGLIGTVFAILTLIFTFIGYYKFKQADKLVDERLKEKMDEFELNLEDRLILLQETNQKMQACYSLIEQKEFDKAIDLLKVIENISPRTFNLYNTLGYVYLEKSQYNCAKEAFEIAIKIRPNALESYNDMSNFYIRINDENNAKKYKDLALKLENKSKKFETINS